MARKERNIVTPVGTTLHGMGVIVLTLACLIVLLWICIIIMRVVMG